MINILGLNVHLYGLIVGVAIWIALEISKKTATEKNIPEVIVEKTFVWVVVMGIIGARAYHVADLWNEYYLFHPERIFYLWEGGLGIWGAVLGGMVGIFLAQKFSGVKRKFLDLTDIGVIGLPLAQAVGRLGNLVNGELFGRLGEPLFAFEGGLNLVLFMILWKTRHYKRSGGLTAIYLIGYGIIRLILENLREPAVIWKIAGVPTASIFGLTAIALGLLIISRRQS